VREINGKETYSVILSGKIATGRDSGTVRKNLADILKVSQAELEPLFSGRPLTIKKNVDQSTARKYVLAFENAGVLCSMAPSDDIERLPAASLSRPANETLSNPCAEEEVTCPQCGRLQAKAPGCIQCGIIFDRYRKVAETRSAPSLSSGSIVIYDTVKERKQIVLLCFLLIILSIAVYNFLMSREIRYPPGVLVGSEPRQVIIRNPESWKIGNREIVPLAAYSLTARVLGKEQYRFDDVADISPIDLALGWGPMSDQSILDKLDISQGSRWCFLYPKTPSVPLPTLMQCSSNMHIIPADGSIKRRLKRLRVGEIIDLSGYLIGVREGGRWIWVTSLTNTQTGAGACKVFWVEHLSIRKVPGG
jgi:hypothetical protein